MPEARSLAIIKLILKTVSTTNCAANIEVTYDQWESAEELAEWLEGIDSWKVACKVLDHIWAAGKSIFTQAEGDLTIFVDRYMYASGGEQDGSLIISGPQAHASKYKQTRWVFLIQSSLSFWEFISIWLPGKYLENVGL